MFCQWLNSSGIQSLLWDSLHLIVLKAQFSDRLKKIYDFVDFLILFLLERVVSCSFLVVAIETPGPFILHSKYSYPVFCIFGFRYLCNNS